MSDYEKPLFKREQGVVSQAASPPLTMKRDEYVKFHEGFCAQMIEVTKKKNADYAGNGTDAFANFRMSESMGVASAELGVFIRMSDKMSRLASFIKRGELQVKDESVHDTLQDLANYCAIMSGILKSKGK